MVFKKYIGDRAFYSKVFAITIPILVQNVITNFVSLIDNIMVGRLGTEPMSGVAIVNQLLFIFNLCIFGGISGAGIFTAQYYGKGDQEGIRHTFRIMLFGLLPFAVSQTYAGTLKETGETVLPMKAGIAAVLVNFCLNYVLIFGKFGAPKLGVTGAAIATVISRIVECLIVIIWTHRHREKNPFIAGVYRSFHVPSVLVWAVVRKGLPLMVNEVLWSIGMTMLTQCYSTRGLEAISATNISSTVSNLFFCAFFAFGNAISIIVGHLLGSGDLKRAKDEDSKLIFCAVVICFFVGGIMALCAPFIPQIYNTTDLVKQLATQFLLVSSALMPFNAFTHAAYFTLRSGGQTVVTFLFDSCFIWIINIPLAFCLSRFTSIAIFPLYLAVSCIDIIKCFVGYFLIKKGVWLRNLVGEKA